MDLGFAQAGFHPVLAIEAVGAFAWAYAEAALPLYRDYCPGCPSQVLQADITRLSGREILSTMEGLAPANPFGVPVVGVLGGPPCQDFSVAGKNQGVSGERGRLIYDFLEKVRSLRPIFFVFENVKGLYATRKHRVSAFERLVEEFERMGYWLSYRVLNALEYGVPQDRERVFVVGFDVLRYPQARGAFAWPKPLYPGAKGLPWPTQNPPGIPLEPHPSLPRALMVHTAFQGVEGLPNQEEQLRPRSSKFGWIPEGDDRRKSYKRLHRYRYSPTVAYGHNEVHLHPTEPRRLSVREALRLQTVPDAYVLPRDLPLSRKFALVSNGVPTRLAHLLALAVRQALVRLREGEG